MRLRSFVVDAFTDRVFAGNPAAVVPLEVWPSDLTLQLIAAENNLAETAFFAPASGTGTDYHLRWFTPLVEMDLCGHATLATHHVLAKHLGVTKPLIKFTSKSGVLETKVVGPRIVLDFPARAGVPREIPEALVEALGDKPTSLYASRDWLAVFEHHDQVRDLRPDFAKIAALEAFGVIATAPGETRSQIDFVSRFFAPKAGVPEDPVTGSAHCTLIPYWATRLQKPSLRARQISPRGGDLWCENVPGRARVLIGGQAVTFSEAMLNVP